MSSTLRRALETQTWLLQEYMVPVGEVFLQELVTRGVLTEAELADIQKKCVESWKVTILTSIVWEKSDDIVAEFCRVLEHYHPTATALLNNTTPLSYSGLNSSIKSVHDVERVWRSKNALLKATLSMVLKDSEEQYVAGGLDHSNLVHAEHADRVQTENESLTHQLEEAVLCEKQTCDENASLEEAIRERDDLNSNLVTNSHQHQHVVTSIEKDNDNLKQQLDTANQQIQTVTGNMHEKTAIAKKQEQTIKDLKRENQALTREQNELQENINKINKELQEIKDLNQSELFKLTEKNTSLENSTAQVKKEIEAFKSENVKAQENFHRWQKANAKANAEITKLNEQLSSVWDMYYNASDQSTSQCSVIRKMKQDMDQVDQFRLFLQLKIKDMKHNLAAKTQAVSELSLEIENYKVELGLKSDASHKEVDDRIQYLLNREKDANVVTDIQSKLQTDINNT